MKIAATGLFCAAALVALAACDPRAGVEEADLVAEPRPGGVGPNGFCWLTPQGLRVQVRNQSNIDVFEQTTTRVTFFTSAAPIVFDLDTSPMAGGSSTRPTDATPVTIPGACFNPDCNFTIEVDAGREVDNEHDHNNVATGICIG